MMQYLFTAYVVVGYMFASSKRLGWLGAGLMLVGWLPLALWGMASSWKGGRRG